MNKQELKTTCYFYILCVLFHGYIVSKIQKSVERRNLLQFLELIKYTNITNIAMQTQTVQQCVSEYILYDLIPLDINWISALHGFVLSRLKIYLFLNV